MFKSTKLFSAVFALVAIIGSYAHSDNNKNTKFKRNVIATGYSYIFGFSYGDFDNDGHMDFAFPDVRRGNELTRTENGTQISDLHIAYGGTDNKVTLLTIDNGQPGFYERQKAADINGDGLLDIVVVNNRDHEVFWFQNLGNRRWEKHRVTNELNRPYDVAIADFNQDGYADIAVSGYVSNELNIFYNLMGQRLLVHHLFPKINVWQKVLLGDKLSENRFVGLGDIDSDGFIDVVSGSAGAENLPAYVDNPRNHAARLSWFKNPGADKGLWVENIIDNSNAARGIGHGQVIDLNGDNMVEILLVKGMREALLPINRHVVEVYQLNDEGAWESSTIVKQPNVIDAKAGFINGDSALDFALISHVPTNLVTVLLSDKVGYQSVIIDDAIPAPNQLELVDIDADGDLDVVVAFDNGNGGNRASGGNKLIAYVNVLNDTRQ